MATGTLGTTAQTSLTSLRISSNMAAADVAAIKAIIFRDNNPANNTNPEVARGVFNVDGLTLELPGGRGRVLLKTGDVLAVDPTTGWPIVVSQNCATTGAIVTTS